MLEFYRLTLKNFMSYGNDETEFYFNKSETKLISGENLDAPSPDGVRSNGAGKTVIINALSFALFGKPISKIKKVDKLINIINKKKMFVSIEFKCKGLYYKVIRARKMKPGADGNFVKLYRSDIGFEDIENEKNDISRSNDATTKDIEKIINITYDVFIRSVLFSAKKEPFLSLPENATSGPSQVSIIETLFGLTELSNKADYLKKVKIKDLEIEIKLLKQEIEQQQEELKKYDQLMSSTNDRLNQWNNDHNEKIKRLENDLITLNDIDFDMEIDLHNQLKYINDDELKINQNIKILNQKVNEFKTQIESINRFKQMITSTEEKMKSWETDKTDKLDSLKEEVSSLLKIDFDQELKNHQTVNDLTNKLSQIDNENMDNKGRLKRKTKEEIELSKEIKHLKEASCPYCEQHFAEAEEKLKECLEKHELLKNEINDINTLIEQHDKDKKNLNNELLIIEEKLIYPTQSKCEKTIHDFDSKQEKIKELECDTNPHIEHYESLLKEMPDDSDQIILDLEKDITNVNKEILILNDDLDSINQKSKNIKNQLTFSDINECQKMRDKSRDLEKELSIAKKETNPHTDHLNDLMKQKPKDPCTKELDDAEEKLAHMKMLHKLLTKKDSFIRKALQQKNIPYLNNQIQGYNSFLGLPHNVIFTDDMSVRITLFDRELDYGNLSSGQQALLDISIAFAFRDVLQKLNTNINLWIVDEALDGGLDAIGLMKAAQILKRKARKEKTCLLVVSHRDELKNSFDKNLTIVLDKGFSRIKKGN